MLMTRAKLVRRLAGLAFIFTVWTSALSAAETPVALPPTPPRPGAEAGPTKVSYAVWIADITRIDSVDQTFSENVVIVLRWNDPTLRHAGPGAKQYALQNIWHPPVLILNESGETKRSLPDVAEVALDGTVTLRQRLIGTFVHKLDLRAFPFDRAEFPVHVVSPGHLQQDVEFQPEPSAVAAGMRDGIGRAERVTLQDWRVLSIAAGPQPYTVLPGLELAGFTFKFAAARNSQYFAIKVILPLLLIVMMSWAVFWIDPTEVGTQFSIAVTSMLTLIAYRFAIETNIPKLPYLTRLDTFILMSSLLVFISLIEVLVVTKFAKHDRLEQARTIDRRCRWIFPLIFGITSTVVFLR